MNVRSKVIGWIGALILLDGALGAAVVYYLELARLTQTLRAVAWPFATILCLLVVLAAFGLVTNRSREVLIAGCASLAAGLAALAWLSGQIARRSKAADFGEGREALTRFFNAVGVPAVFWLGWVVFLLGASLLIAAGLASGPPTRPKGSAATD